MGIRIALWLIGAVVLAAAGGCGDNAEDDARAAVEAYVDSLRDGDPDAVCSQLTPGELEDLSAASSCAEVFTRAFALLERSGVEIPRFEISELSVDGDEGEVTLVSEGVEQAVPLAKVDGEWKLAGATTIDQFHPDDPLAEPGAN